jgi:hypothetical protein
VAKAKNQMPASDFIYIPDAVFAPVYVKWEVGIEKFHLRK